MGIGSARGDDRAVQAAEQAISTPLLEASIDGAHGVLLSIQGGSDLGLFEINEAARLVQEAAHPEANIIFGAVIDDALGDEVRVTVIAAGFDCGTPVRRRDERALGQVSGRRQQGSAVPPRADAPRRLGRRCAPAAPAPQHAQQPPAQPPPGRGSSSRSTPRPSAASRPYGQQEYAPSQYTSSRPRSAAASSRSRSRPRRWSPARTRSRSRGSSSSRRTPRRRVVRAVRGPRRTTWTCPTSSSEVVDDLRPVTVPDVRVPLLDAGLPAGVRGGFTTRAGGAGRAPFDGLNLGDHVGDDPAAGRRPPRRAARRRWARPPWCWPSRSTAPTSSRSTGARRASRRGPTPWSPPCPDWPWPSWSPTACRCCWPTRRAGLVAVAHAGRPGLVAGVVPAVVAAHARARRRRDLVAVVGPRHLRRLLRGARGRWPRTWPPGSPRPAPPRRWGTPAVDVAAGVLAQLRRRSASPTSGLGGCTAEDDDLFSYRRDGRTGRSPASSWCSR